MSRLLISGAAILLILSGAVFVSAGNADRDAENPANDSVGDREASIEQVNWSIEGQNSTFSGPFVVRNLSAGTHNVTINVLFSDGHNETFRTRVSISQ